MKRQIIYCPECQEFLYDYRGHTTMDLDIRCRRCGRYYNINPAANVVKQIVKPERTTASGARFY